MISIFEFMVAETSRRPAHRETHFRSSRIGGKILHRFEQNFVARLRSFILTGIAPSARRAGDRGTHARISHQAPYRASYPVSSSSRFLYFHYRAILSKRSARKSVFASHLFDEHSRILFTDPRLPAWLKEALPASLSRWKT